MNSDTENQEIIHVLTVIDGKSEELLDLVVIRQFELKKFRKQFAVAPEDPHMLDKYVVGPDDVSFVNEAIGAELEFNFSEYGYFIEAARRE